MKKIKHILRIIGQSILIILFGLLGGLLFKFKIPGNHTFTDDDAGPLVIVYGIFVIIGLGLLINALIFKSINHWKNFRIAVIIFVFFLGSIVFMPRDVIKWSFLGEKKQEYTSLENPDLIYVKLELYKNNSFICSTSHGGEMIVENIGKYEFKNNHLELTLENEISEHVKKYYKTLYNNIGTNYKIINDTLNCENCREEIKLTKN